MIVWIWEVRNFQGENHFRTINFEFFPKFGHFRGRVGGSDHIWKIPDFFFFFFETFPKGLTHPPLVEKKIKRHVVFLGFSAHLGQKKFLNFFTLKISNLSYSVGHRGRCWLVVGGSYWWLVTVQWVGGWPWLVCIGWWVGSDLSSQFYIYFVQCCLTQCLTWPPPYKGEKKLV